MSRTARARFVGWLDYHLQTGAPLPPNTEQGLDAIESEAVSRYRAALRVAVLNIDAQTLVFRDVPLATYVDRAAVLRLIDETHAS